MLQQVMIEEAVLVTFLGAVAVCLIDEVHEGTVGIGEIIPQGQIVDEDPEQMLESRRTEVDGMVEQELVGSADFGEGECPDRGKHPEGGGLPFLTEVLHFLIAFAAQCECEHKCLLFQCMAAAV